jgi:cytosine/adenosine deaminase-related metal-dependent hydrolase
VNPDGVGTLAVAAATAADDPVRPDELLRMRCVGAAATMGVPDLGAVRVGHRADLVVRRPGASVDLGADPALETAVLGSAGSVRTVLVDGTEVVREGVPTRADELELVRSARRSARALLERITPR